MTAVVDDRPVLDENAAPLAAFWMLVVLGHVHAWRFTYYGYEVWVTNRCAWLDERLEPFAHYAWRIDR